MRCIAAYFFRTGLRIKKCLRHFNLCSFWRRTFLYGKKVSLTLHEEPSVLPQSTSFWRRTFLYGKKESCKQDSPPAADCGSDMLPLRRSAIISFCHMDSGVKRSSRQCHKPLQALQAAAQKFDKFLILVQ